MTRLGSSPRCRKVLIRTPIIALREGPVPVDSLVTTVVPRGSISNLGPTGVKEVTYGSIRPLFCPYAPLKVMDVLHRCRVRVGKGGIIILNHDSVIKVPVTLVLGELSTAISVYRSRATSLRAIAEGTSVLIITVKSPGFIRNS